MFGLSAFAPHEGNILSICILHANCQGGPLSRLFLASSEFSRRWDILHVPNYDRTPIPADALESCDLFLYQHLGPQWGELASARLLARLPVSARSIRLPNLFFQGYWPLWTSDSTMNFGDIYLDYLTDKGLTPAEIMHVYLHGRLDAVYNLEVRIQNSRNYQQAKDAGALVSLEDYIDAHWREEQLFSTSTTVPKISLMVADAVLAELGLSPLPPPYWRRKAMRWNATDICICPSIPPWAADSVCPLRGRNGATVFTTTCLPSGSTPSPMWIAAARVCRFWSIWRACAPEPEGALPALCRSGSPRLPGKENPC